MFDLSRINRTEATIKPLYELYIEISTRKLAMPLDEHDSIQDIHSSWYKFFEATRQSLKNISTSLIFAEGDQAFEVVKLIQQVLELVRSHLKKYYKNFSHYLNKLDLNYGSVQENEKSYPIYAEMVFDINFRKDLLIALKKELENFLFQR